MSNENLRDKIASCVRDYDGYNGNSSEVSDDILATIKADDDAKDKRIAELEAKLAKAIDVAFDLGGISVEAVGHKRSILWPKIRKARATLEELKGTDQ